ncbi:MAG: hypothetical protein A4S08_00940 [Proteobacteria bacterium SG_bin4]|nr:MAG: hypothetical protein A4S08_00940 [Proteobacteria bacterium SG_bin4]
MHQYPFHLESDLSEFSVASDLKIKKIDPELREQLFGIRDLKKNETGYSYTSHGFSDIPDAGFLTTVLLKEKLSNYVLLTADSSRANEFNLALKLIGNSSTSLFTGFGTLSPSRSYVSLCSYDLALPPLKVTEQEVFSLEKLVSQIHNSCREDKKFQILMDTYLHAMFHGIRSASRFVEFSIILEMLLLPIQNNELKYRFSLRLAKFMNKYFNCSVHEVFNRGKQIYDTRSSIVHAGEDKHNKLESTTKIAHEYVRRLLTKYLEDKSLFDDKKLDDLCLN